MGLGLGFGFGLGLGSEGSTLPAPALPPLRAPKPVLTPPGLNGSVRPRLIEALGGGLGVVAARTLPMVSARPRLAGTFCRSHQSKAFAGAPR